MSKNERTSGQTPDKTPAKAPAKPPSESGIAYSIRIGKPHQVSVGLLYAIIAVFVLLIVWAAYAEVETLTRTDGRVIPSARLQVVQNLEGGIVREIHVRQGEMVEKGALIISLSPTQAGGEYESRKTQAVALIARTARLRAEAAGADKPVFPPEARLEGGDYVAAESAEFASRRARLDLELSVIDSQAVQRRKEAEDTRVTLATVEGILKSAREERVIVARLVERGLEPRLELVRLEGRLGEMEGKRESARLAIPRLEAALEELQARRSAAQRQYRTEAAAELSRVTGELRAQEKLLPMLSDRVDRTELRAPMKGIVNRLFVSTVGGVVKPGEPLAEIVPADDELVIEARIQPKDIGFVTIGQPARVKLTAYDYSIFGSMEGVVTRISPDAVQVDERESFYLARIETRTTMMEVLGRKLPILPGMQAQADIITGRKTVLNYLTKPLVAMKENAFRER
jgi:adhesin transport system membrane fusion protein